MVGCIGTVVLVVDVIVDGIGTVVPCGDGIVGAIGAMCWFVLD